jgi:thiaminase
MRERLEEAQKYYADYIERYPEGEFLNQANELKAEMQLLYEELDTLEL